MEDFLALIFIVCGGAAVLLAFSPIGRALADRIRHREPADVPDPAIQEELQRLRDEVSELQERVDFAERLLAQRDEPTRLPAR